MPRLYRDWQPEIGPPWIQAPRGRAFEQSFGRAKDDLCAWCAAAVRARVIDTADEQALAHLGAERGLVRLPNEFLEAYRERVRKAWAFWRMGGTRPGMQMALEMLGYNVKIIEHGLSLPEGEEPPDRNKWSEFTIWLTPGENAGMGAIQWGETFTDAEGRTRQHMWGDEDLRWGTTLPLREQWRIMQTICQMKSAHSKPRHVFYSPGAAHFWGEPDLAWGDDGLVWGMEVGSLEIPIPQGKMCEPGTMPAPRPPVGSGARWGGGTRWGDGTRWGAGG